MDKLTPDERESWHEVVSGTTKVIFAVTLFLVLGVVIIATIVNEQPLWCLVVSLVTIALGKKVYDAVRGTGFNN